MFADMADFTPTAEKLGEDATFTLMQRLIEQISETVHGHDGTIQNLTGDGVMALFGIDGEPKEGCRRALIAARAIAASLKDLNANLQEDLDEAIRIGIGVHVGTVIVGEMGYAAVRSVTAVGDAVNTASRLETANKEFLSQLVVSRDVSERAAVDLSQFPLHEIDVRGRVERIAVHVLEDATRLPELTAFEPA